MKKLILLTFLTLTSSSLNCMFSELPNTSRMEDINIFQAIDLGYTDRVRTLIQEDPTLVNDNGKLEQLLVQAIQCSRCAASLPGARDHKFYTNCSDKENTQIVDLFLSYNPPIGEDKLKLAIRNSHPATLLTLLQHGADDRCLRNCKVNRIICGDDAEIRFNEKTTQLVQDWPDYKQHLMRSAFAFFMAQHPRCGQNSFARELPRELFRDITQHYLKYVLRHTLDEVHTMAEQERALRQPETKWCCIQ